MSNDKLYATISTLVPTIMSVIFERGIPGYMNHSELTENEKRVSEEVIKALLTASFILGATDYLSGIGYHWDDTMAKLVNSIPEFKELTSDQMDNSKKFIQLFFDYRIIRENHSFDDWITETWWEHLQDCEYRYPSALSEAIAYSLQNVYLLNKLTFLDPLPETIH